ncbi:hypothetical protein [Streptomyces sp. NPDC056154]|uniref:hypothetical protein n=1 Tax=unclassified Streptomyces TaxID=2593676 RepID=UPI0035D5445B
MGLLVITRTGRAGQAGASDAAGAADAVVDAADAVGTAGRGGRGIGIGRRMLAYLFVLPLVTAGLLLTGAAASSAHAATVCPGRLAKAVPFKTGELRVYKSRSYACAVAVAKKPGPRRKMSVTIQPRGGSPVVDSGTYTKQAGPVTVHALNRCVRASATIEGKSGSTGWILC